MDIYRGVMISAGRLKSERSGRRRGGGAKRRFMDAVKVGVELISVKKRCLGQGATEATDWL